MNALNWKKVCGIVGGCLAVAAALLCARTFGRADTLEKSIGSYLRERNINYTSTDISKNTLTVNLVSTGSDRCTIDDVKAIHSIYTAVHSRDVDDTIQNVQINIFNSDEVPIYDHYQADAAIANDASRHWNDENANLLSEAPENALRLITASHPFTVEHLNFLKADGINGQSADISVTPMDINSVTLSDLRILYEEIEEYAVASGAITQCSLSMINEKNECMLYLTGDMGYGNIIAWVSPEMEANVMENEGPKH